jgi:hypothetical protein
MQLPSNFNVKSKQPFITARILFYMLTDFKKIDSLTPSDFEIFVRDVFVAAGWTDALITKVGFKQRQVGSTVDVKALNHYTRSIYETEILKTRKNNETY